MHLGMTPSEYAEVDAYDRIALEGFMLDGPSPLRQIILVGQIKNMLQSHFTQKPVRSDAMNWLDGLLANPAVARERREERRQEARINQHLAALSQTRGREGK